NWLDLLEGHQLTSTTNAPAESVTRTTRFVPDTAVNSNSGWPTGETVSIEIEPFSSDPSTHLLRTFGRDERGQIRWITDKAMVTGGERTTGYAYEDADGVYVTTTTDALRHTTRVWRHPGFGFIVQANDVNGMATTTTYDTFGRPIADKAPSGATTTMYYPT